MEDPIGLNPRDEPVQRLGIRELSHAAWRLERVDAPGIGVNTNDEVDVVAVREQATREVGTHEAGGAGDEGALHGLRAASQRFPSGSATLSFPPGSRSSPLR